MLGINYFGIVDYLVLVGSMVVCLLVGVYYVYFSKHTNDDLLIGGRDMSSCPVASSIMVSFFSAITILGFPAEIYNFGIEIMMQIIMQCLGIWVAGIVFVPFFYEMRNKSGLQLTSIYEYLELRFNSLAIRRIAASIFLVEQLLIAGLVLYAPSIAMQTFLGLPLATSILGIGICCTLYTSLGGLKAVVWTDTFQFLLIVIGLVAIMAQGFNDAGGVANAFAVAHERGRLNLLNFTIDPFMRHNVLNFFLGSFVVTAVRMGIHQVLVQRYLSLPSVEKAQRLDIHSVPDLGFSLLRIALFDPTLRTVWLSVPFKFAVMAIMTLTGIALFAAEANCDPVKSGKLKKMDQMVANFVVEKLSFIPGFLGIFTACLFSGVLSSLSSQLNSLAAVTWEDFLSRVPYFAKMNARSQTNVSRILSLAYGVIAIGLAFAAQHVRAIYAGSFALAGVTMGALVGIFFMGMFFPFVNKIVILALIFHTFICDNAIRQNFPELSFVMGGAVGFLVGLSCMAYVCGLGLIFPPDKVTLPTSVENCITNSSMIPLPVTQAPSLNSSDAEVLNFPKNLSRLSYIMYPFVGLMIAILAGTLTSAVTGGFTLKQRSTVETKNLHFWVRRWAVQDKEHSNHHDMAEIRRK